MATARAQRTKKILGILDSVSEESENRGRHPKELNFYQCILAIELLDICWSRGIRIDVIEAITATLPGPPTDPAARKEWEALTHRGVFAGGYIQRGDRRYKYVDFSDHRHILEMKRASDPRQLSADEFKRERRIRTLCKFFSSHKDELVTLQASSNRIRPNRERVQDALGRLSAATLRKIKRL